MCRRSSTACGTCRHFRRSVAARLGYCGLDRKRQPLAGDEIRACWEAWPGGAMAHPEAVTIGPAAPVDAPGRREFIEVGRADEPPLVPVDAHAEPRWDLWGDLDL